jgi:NitT/TauT family transport system ATP-binding protein
MQEAVIPTESLIPAPAVEAIIRAEKIEKYYAQPSQNRIQVISATDLSIVPGEIVALLGPSGSGKSTILRMLTGLSTPTAGQVYWHEKPIADAEINVSIVFQSFALFPWLTVLENVEAPLQARGVAADVRRDRSMKMLDTVGLDGFEAAYPKELIRRHEAARRLCPRPGGRAGGALSWTSLLRPRRAHRREPAQ